MTDSGEIVPRVQGDESEKGGIGGPDHRDQKTSYPLVRGAELVRQEASDELEAEQRQQQHATADQRPGEPCRQGLQQIEQRHLVTSTSIQA